MAQGNVRSVAHRRRVGSVEPAAFNQNATQFRYSARKAGPVQLPLPSLGPAFPRGDAGPSSRPFRWEALGNIFATIDAYATGPRLPVSGHRVRRSVASIPCCARPPQLLSGSEHGAFG